jgi:hypothetical protein
MRQIRLKGMLSRSPVTIAIIIFLSIWSAWCITAGAAEGTTPATDRGADSAAVESGSRTIYERSDRAIADAPEDPANLLEQGEQRRKQRDALIEYTLFDWLRTPFQRGTEALYDATSLKLGINWDSLAMWMSDGFPDTDREGVSSVLGIIGNWELVNKGKPSQGQLLAHVEGRWDYGTTAPSTLGDVNLGTMIRTADPFNSYTPTFLLRNGYWQQGSRTAGWIYRLGKITPDQTLGTSYHLNPFRTFLPSGSVGMNAPQPDSGLGAVGIKYFGDNRSYILGLISDANGDREDFGDIGEGDFFKAIEFGYKIRPMTKQAGYSKLTFTQTDGTADGRPKNVSLGPSGWSVAGKLEQELSDDGRWIGILKYGRTFDESGLYKHLASGHLLLYDPVLPLVRKIANDVVGAGVVWTESWIPNTQEETAVEVFYRFPLFYQLDLTLSYQSFFNPARNPDVDQASVFGIRARTTF